MLYLKVMRLPTPLDFRFWILYLEQSSRSNDLRKKSSIQHPASSIRMARGFTLIELLVVVGIMGALTAFVLPSLRNFGQTQTLNSAADQIASDIRRTQSNALSGDKSLCVNQLRGWYIFFKKSDSNGIYYQIKSSCYNSATKTWNDLPQPCPNTSNPIYLPKDITNLDAVIKSSSGYISSAGVGSIMFYGNGSGPSPDPGILPKPPNYVDMFVRECVGVDGNSNIVNGYPTLSPVAQNAKAVLTLTSSSGDSLAVTVCNNGSTKIASIEQGC